MQDETQKKRQQQLSDFKTIPKSVDPGNRKQRRALAAQLRARKKKGSR